METIAIRSVDDLFPALSKLYKGDDEQAEFSARLGDLCVEAERTGNRTLATRALWAQAAVLKSKEPDRARKELVEVSERVNVQTDNPLLLADCADALLAAGKQTEAEKMFRDLVKWNPRAPQKDRALAALGRIEMQRARRDCIVNLSQVKQSRLSNDGGLIFLLKDGKEVVLSRRQTVLFRATRGL
jgi:predicted Zn-dependent protease